MGYCILAIKDNHQYRSVYCRDQRDISHTLSHHYSSLSAAKCLVGLGDISQLNENNVRAYFRDWGFAWEYTHPKLFEKRSELLNHGRMGGADCVYIFDANHWEKVVTRSFAITPMDRAA